MCLLFLMHEMADSLDITLSAVHIEHGIRGEASTDDMHYVEEQCERLGVPLTIERVDAPSVARATGTTLEEAARNERYRAFEQLGADRIALAHHMNDQAETVLFNLARGTGIRGTGGIQPVRDRYIRPILCLTRQETEEYCRRYGIEYRTDSTNEDTELSRNRIRHRVIGELEMINDQAVRHICETAGDLQEIEDYLRSVTEREEEACVSYLKDRTEIDIERLSALHPVLASRLVRQVLSKVAGRSKDIGRKHVEAVLSLMKGQSGRQTGLIYGLRAGREFGKIVVRAPGRYETVSPDKGNGSPDIRFDVLEREQLSEEDIVKDNNYTKYIDYATIIDAVETDGLSEDAKEADPLRLLTVRKRQPGDYISIKNGRKKLKDLLIEEKIAPDRRDEMYFVSCGQEIIWIPDTGRIGERCKVTDTTEKVIRMEIKNG